MSKELVISANRHETRVAMIEDDQVVEIFHQRENEYSLAGGGAAFLIHHTAGNQLLFLGEAPQRHRRVSNRLPIEIF